MKKTLILFISIFALLSCGDGKPKLSEAELDEMVEKQFQEKMEAIEKEAMEDQFKWIYENEKDDMTDEIRHIARITSRDIARLDFPYEGGTYLTLYVRKQGNKQAVFVSSSNGQIHDDYRNPIMTVRFDDDEPINFGVSESSDNESTIRFINSPDKFIERLKKSKKLKIQVEYYSNGRHVFTYDTNDLKWEY